MSLWQFMAAVTGWNKAQGGDDKPAAPTKEEFYDLVERLG
jgi:hypothetical protein